VDAVADTQPKWTDVLTDEELAFIKRFVLASGSLKALAQAYGVSYPTIRLRLDRLIAKVEVLESQQVTDEFERQLRLLYAEGKLDMPTVKTLLAAHRNALEADDDA
jgi:hypothetical protein